MVKGEVGQGKRREEEKKKNKSGDATLFESKTGQGDREFDNVKCYEPLA